MIQKELIKIGLIFALIIAFSISLATCIHLQKEKRQTKQVATTVQSDSVFYYRSKVGTLISEKDNISATLETTKLFYQKQLDEVKRISDIKENKISSLLILNANLSKKDTGKTIITFFADTNHSVKKIYPIYSFATDTGCIKMYGHADSSGSVVYIYGNIPIDAVIHWKRKWFLGRKKYKVAAFSRCNEITIDTITSLTIKKGY